MKKLNKLIEYLFYIFLFILPWQTRLIIHQGTLNGGPWEWGTISLYGSDLVFILLCLLFCLKIILDRHSEKKHLPRKMLSFVSLFLFFALASIFWANNHGLAFYWWLRLLEAIILFIFIQKITFSFNKACWSLVFAGLIQLGLAISQFITQHVFSSKWLGMAAQNVLQAGTSVVETAEGRMLRLYGSFSHPNIFAGFLVFLIFILFVLYFYNYQSWQKWIILFFASLMTMALYFTYSRAAWVALLVNFILLAILIFRKSPKNFRPPFLDFFGLVLIIFIMFSCFTARDFMARVSAQGRLENISLNQRIVNFDQAQEIVKENFLFGVGIGNYTQQLFNKFPNLDSWDYQPVANIYFLILAELGFIGLVLFLMTVLFGSLRLGFNIFSPLVFSLLTLGLFDHWIFSLSFGILLFWLALGLVWKRRRIHELTGQEDIF
jgi:O-antigen ligase